MPRGACPGPMDAPLCTAAVQAAPFSLVGYALVCPVSASGWRWPCHKLALEFESSGRRSVKNGLRRRSTAPPQRRSTVTPQEAVGPAAGAAGRHGARGKLKILQGLMSRWLCKIALRLYGSHCAEAAARASPGNHHSRIILALRRHRRPTSTST